MERNLCGGRDQHAAPDWRLSARLRLSSPLRLGLREYRLLRGILAHNITASASEQLTADRPATVITTGNIPSAPSIEVWSPVTNLSLSASISF